jgi:coenzyme PQQ precursor peptide PqqA
MPAKRLVVGCGLRQYCVVALGRGDADGAKPRRSPRGHEQEQRSRRGGPAMAWTTPILVEICIGLEINGYLPAEF